jgi:hypothetical protein
VGSPQRAAERQAPRAAAHGLQRRAEPHELSLTREVIVKEIETKVRGWCHEWLHNHSNYIERVVKTQLIPIVEKIVKEKIVVTIAPNVTVEVKP